MRRRLWFLFLVVVLAATVAWLSMRAKERVVSQGALYAYRGNIYESLFREPYETLIFIMEDGTFFGFTTQEDNWVRGAPGFTVEYLQKSGYGPGKIRVCIHNHFDPSGFSDDDKRLYRRLRDGELKGQFGIYYPATGKCRWMPDEEKSK